MLLDVLLTLLTPDEKKILSPHLDLPNTEILEF